MTQWLQRIVMANANLQHVSDSDHTMLHLMKSFSVILCLRRLFIDLACLVEGIALLRGLVGTRKAPELINIACFIITPHKTCSNPGRAS
jgi:hypothetical protein